MTYRPLSYGEMVEDAVRSIIEAMKDGDTRMEVEFPSVPVSTEGETCKSNVNHMAWNVNGSSLTGYKVNSDVIVDANAQLAIAAAKLVSGILVQKCSCRTKMRIVS